MTNNRRVFKWGIIILILGYLLVAIFYQQKEVVTVANVGKDTTWNFSLHQVIPMQFDYPYYVYIDGELDEEAEVDFSFTVAQKAFGKETAPIHFKYKYGLPKGKVKRYYMIEYAAPETSHFIPKNAKKGRLTFTYTTGRPQVEQGRLGVDYIPQNKNK